MRVWELREALANVDPDAIVVNPDGESVFCGGYTMLPGELGVTYPAFVLDVVPSEKALNTGNARR